MASLLRTFVYVMLPQIFPFLDLVTLHHISHVSRSLRLEVKTYLRCQLHRTLRHWFFDPVAFRSCMRDNRAVISGSVALAIVLQSTWYPNDLDIYVPKGYRYPMLHYLISKEGYRPIRTETATNISYLFSRPVIRSVTTLVKDDDRKLPRTIRRIDIIEAVTRSPFCPLTLFPGTWAINWIDADEIAVSYPRLTLQGKGFTTRVRESMSGRERRWIRKYEARGIRVLDPRDQPLRPGQPCGATCVAWLRCTSDRQCLRMKLGAENTSKEVPQAVWLLLPKLFQARKCVNPFCPLYIQHLPHHIPAFGL